MSLQIAAQHLSSQGRGNDSMLVHMSPREVNSLNAIAKAHGGQLTINPKTGLAEAGFLESILPMAAGAALVASGVGVPYAALMVGGGTALMTGSLEKGLMAGLGAYGGAGLGSSLMASGATPAAAGATELGISEAMQAQHAAQVTAAQTAQQAQQAAAIQNAAIQNTAAVPAFNPAQPAASFDASKFVPPPAAPITAAPNPNLPPQIGPNSPSFQANVPSFMDNIKSMGSNISPSNLMKFAKEDPLSAASGAASLYPTKKKEEEAKADASMGQRYAFSPGYANPMPGASATGQEQTFSNPAYRPIGNEEAKKIYGYAEGGTSEADPAAPPVPASYTAAEPTTPISKPIPVFEIPEVDSLAELIRAKESQRFIDAYLNRPAPIDVQEEYNDYLQRTLNAPSMGKAAGGSISDAAYNLGSYSDGGRLLRGPGDGVSDSIPAVIGKKQPARLADGEFVVPARIVSELGNGSTEAGARKLYAMMDRIQKARKKTVGKNKVAKNSRSDKYLPA